MRVVQPKPFTFEAGKRAVLLLHGFTGNPADVRMIGRYLQKKGYTCHGPLYSGHGVPPEDLMQTRPEDWWQDVTEGYNFLKEKGHDEIAVCGLSLGGVFSLKLGYTVPIKGIIPMCAPMHLRDEQTMINGMLEFAERYKRQEGKNQEEIETEMEAFKEKPKSMVKIVQQLNAEIRENVDMIYAPIFIVQGRHDHMIDMDSANIIYHEVQSEVKELKWYEESGHLITFDKEKEQLHEDIYRFLEELDWEN